MELSEWGDAIAAGVSAMSFIEIIAVIFALAYVILASYGSILCWPAALVSVFLYIYICYDAQLYMETFLQFFYLVMAVYGWYEWSRGRKPRGELKVESWPLKKIAPFLLICTAGTAIAGYFFHTYTNAALPFLDAFTTIFALYTTYLVTKRVIENWILWIIIDSASIYLYYNRELYLTSVLFGLYTLIAIAGYFKWRQLKQHHLSRV